MCASQHLIVHFESNIICSGCALREHQRPSRLPIDTLQRMVSSEAEIREMQSASLTCLSHWLC